MHRYYDRKPTRPGVALADKRARRRFVANQGASQDTEPLFQKKGEKLEGSALPHLNKQNKTVSEKKSVPENEQDMPLSYYIRGFVRVVQRRFRTMSLPSQIVLVLITLFLITVILNLLIQFVIGLMSLIYTILGIIASAIVIYEFLLKRR